MNLSPRFVRGALCCVKIVAVHNKCHSTKHIYPSTYIFIGGIHHEKVCIIVLAETWTNVPE